MSGKLVAKCSLSSRLQFDISIKVHEKSLVQRVLLLRSMTSSVYDSPLSHQCESSSMTYSDILFTGNRTGNRPNTGHIFCFFTSCLAYTPLYYYVTGKQLRNYQKIHLCNKMNLSSWRHIVKKPGLRGLQDGPRIPVKRFYFT